MKKNLLIFSLLIILLFSLSGCASDNSYNSNVSNSPNSYQPVGIQNRNPQVKKSTSGICHEIGSTYYDRTTNFTPYDSIDECLNSGGRLPKR